MKLENMVPLLAFSLVLLVGLVGCSSSDDDEFLVPVAQAFSGTFITTSGATGTVQLTRVAPVTSAAGGFMSATVDLMGTITPSGGAPVDVSGSIEEASTFFSASGGGYNLSGFFDAGLLGGSLSGPVGSGLFAMIGSNSGAAQSFCGDWTENGEALPGGLFSLTIHGSQAIANVVDFVTNDTIQLTNNLVSGSSVALAAFPEQGIDLRANGTLSGTTVSGTWTGSDDVGGATGGTFQGTTQACN